ncbi:hypothetical protein P9112_009719 [Eukaryota sp. TZLM1-RC]
MLLLRLVFVLPLHRFLPIKPLCKFKQSVSALVLLGSGGHTAEMISLLPIISTLFETVHFVVSKGDEMSKPKLHCIPEFSTSPVSYITRSRKVHQSFLTAIPSSILSLFDSFVLVFKFRPNLLIVNGPGSCVPLVFATFALKFLGHRTRIVYIESVCRVYSLSLSAKCVFPFVDDLIVQWKDLERAGTVCLGRLV